MKANTLHQRLSYYVCNAALSEGEYEDGYYRYQIYIQVDNKNDLIRIKKASINKFLSVVNDETGEVTAPKDYFEEKVEERPSLWTYVKEIAYFVCLFVFGVAIILIYIDRWR